MKTFANSNARDLQHAVSIAQQTRQDGRAASFVGGGSDLLALVKERILTPDVLVNLKTIKGLDQDGDRQVTDINAELDLQTNRTKKAAGVTSVIEKPARKTVSQDAFDRMIAEFSELTNVIGSIASLIVRDHVRALGESMEQFPQTRLTKLLESLSKEISDDKLKADFRERFGKV